MAGLWDVLVGAATGVGGQLERQQEQARKLQQIREEQSARFAYSPEEQFKAKLYRGIDLGKGALDAENQALLIRHLLGLPKTFKEIQGEAAAQESGKSLVPPSTPEVTKSLQGLTVPTAWENLTGSGDARKKMNASLIASVLPYVDQNHLPMLQSALQLGTIGQEESDALRQQFTQLHPEMPNPFQAQAPQMASNGGQSLQPGGVFNGQRIKSVRRIK